MTVFAAACLLLAAAAVGFAVWSRVRAARTLRRLEQMLQAAEDETLLEQQFDESRLSALESRMRHYLTGHAITGVRVRQEKARIQSLISDVSHQLRTPVANLVLYTQLLAEQPLPVDARPLADALAGQAEKLRFLTDVLVKTSRMEAGLLQLHPAAGPVAPAIRKAAAPVLPKLEARGMALILPETDAEAVFDAKWTAEALENLLDNAAKYAPAGSAVTVSVCAYELFCRIDVADCGPGIPEAEQSRIFQRFYRSPSVAEQEGVGIGLFLAREIAEAQGGYLKVASRAGEGSTFSLFLPRDARGAAP